MTTNILQPPRSFRLTVAVTVPEDPRSDQELMLLLLTGVSTTVAVGMLRPTITVDRIPFTAIS